MNHTRQEDDTFEKLAVWQRAQTLAVQVYRLLGDCRDFGFRNQMTDAANSTSNNIAEGAERLSRAEFKQFLGIRQRLCRRNPLPGIHRRRPRLHFNRRGNRVAS